MKLLSVLLIMPAILILSSVSNAKTCYSDFNCRMGEKCVKAPFQSKGDCMQVVDEWGLKTYPGPDKKTDSIMPKLEPDCITNANCPIGFECHYFYKTCIKRY